MPEVVIISGANGAGKSTFARFVLPEAMPFFNADEIAKTLATDFPGNRDREATRLLLTRMDEAVERQCSFAMETTLASRSLATRLREWQAQGWKVHLFFFYLPAPELAAARVACRVRRGGHDIPVETIHRRWSRGFGNLVERYAPIVDTWSILSNIDEHGPTPVARKNTDGSIITWNPEIWTAIQNLAAHP